MNTQAAVAGPPVCGVSPNSGRGTIVGACGGGVLLLVVIQNVPVLADLPGYWINATTGAIILAALFIARVAGGRDQ